MVIAGLLRRGRKVFLPRRFLAASGARLSNGYSPFGSEGPACAAYCRERIAHFKCPRTVDFVPELPRSATGKLYKRVLRDAYWAGHKTSIV
jgi:acyl-coenzyme A synthetase/AMP-(fatty) acid ligase